MELYDRLLAREAAGNPIRVGLVGCGQMGSGFVHVTHQMAGMITAAISDIDVRRPLATFEALGLPEDAVTVTNRRGEAEDALRAGKRVVTEDALLLTQLDGLECLVEATGMTEVGAQVAWNAVMRQRHVVMLNVETDVTVGLYLSRLAERTGCIYTVAAGDEPGVLKGLYDFASSLGFEVVCLGKGKNNPIDYAATPESCRAEAEARGMSPKMLASFVDGSKTMVEMCAVSNATGLTPDVAGMHGPRVDIPDLTKVFIPAEDGGILSTPGRVEYSTGKVAPGVFAIVTSHGERVRTDMRFLGMGDGPNYLLYRPYHLCNIETPHAVAEAVLYGERTVVAKRPVSEVVAIAKRDLRPGDVLGDIGGPEFYNRIYLADEARRLGAIPMGLATGGTVTRAIAKGETITADALRPDASRFVYQLRQMQDAMLAAERDEGGEPS